MDNFQNNNVKNNNVDNYNFKDKVNHKFSKVKENLSKSNSERENFEERTKISNLINEAENKKSSLLIEMGILTYQKIREGYIKIEDFFTIIANDLGNICLTGIPYLLHLTFIFFFSLCQFLYNFFINFCME